MKQRALRLCFGSRGDFDAAAYDLFARLPWTAFLEIEDMGCLLREEAALWRDFEQHEAEARAAQQEVR